MIRDVADDKVLEGRVNSLTFVCALEWALAIASATTTVVLFHRLQTSEGTGARADVMWLALVIAITALIIATMTSKTVARARRLSRSAQWRQAHATFRVVARGKRPSALYAHVTFDNKDRWFLVTGALSLSGFPNTGKRAYVGCDCRLTGDDVVLLVPENGVPLVGRASGEPPSSYLPPWMSKPE